MVELNERASARHSVAAPDSVANALQSGPAVSCRRLSKIFDVIDAGTCWRVVCGLRTDPRRVNALQQVTLDVPKGQVVGIMGRNGAGKSTLLRILAGIYTPTAGEVLVSGEIAGLFELGGGNRFLTGREYAERYLSLRGTDSRERVALIGDIQEFSELGEFFDRRIHTYSTGMAARLYFATATARRHDVYLVDEILSVGDEHFQAKCWARMRDRLQGGASGLLVTHDWPAVMRLCETCYVLDSGRIAAAGPSAKVIPQYLDLSRPATDRARFGRDLPGQVRGASGEDWWLEFAVEALAEVSMEVAFSVERVCAGSEWGILILSRPWPVGRGAGQYRVRIEVPALPLPPGEYQLNLFLSQAAEGPGAAASAVFDVRSWTYGNGIPLQVEGAPRPGLVAMPMRWQADA